MKSLLLGMLLVSPAIGVWVHRGGEEGDEAGQIRNVSHRPVAIAPSSQDSRVAIEILEKGKMPKVIYVEPPAAEAVPEPGMISLLTAASLMALLRRKRS